MALIGGLIKLIFYNSEGRFIVRKGKMWVPVLGFRDYTITEGRTDFGEY